MSIPKVSIIVPIYNAGEYLTSCLDSLINQTLKEIEIICVLDCPTDGSDKIVKEFAEKDERIKIIKNEKNLHIGESRNKGIKAATGEFIGFSDNDDLSDTHLFEYLYTTAKKGNSVVSICRKDEFINETHITNKNDVSRNNAWDYFCELLKVNSSIGGYVWNHIYLRQYILDHNILFPDTKKMSVEDECFNIHVYMALIKEKKEIEYIPDVLYHHRRHSGNTGESDDNQEKRIIYRDYISGLILNSCYKQRSDVINFLNEGNITIIYRLCKRLILQKKFRAALNVIFHLNKYKLISESLHESKVKYYFELSIPKNCIYWISKLFI